MWKSISSATSRHIADDNTQQNRLSDLLTHCRSSQYSNYDLRRPVQINTMALKNHNYVINSSFTFRSNLK
jgi:hypothetical protein